MGWEEDLIPDLEQLVDVDELADETLVPLLEHSLVDEGAVRVVIEVELPERVAPVQLERKTNQATHLAMLRLRYL